jgi:uncharacterized protein with PIN domain
MMQTTAQTNIEQPSTHRRVVFVRCATCGRYLTPEERIEARYCSQECAERFHRCTTCGRYYPVADAYSEEQCSRECAARYSLLRSYGPAQIDIHMEELI